MENFMPADIDADTIANATYLILLGLVLAAGLWLQARSNLGRTLQSIAIWTLIFVGAIAGFAIWEDLGPTPGRQISTVDGTGQISTKRNRDGHYYLTLEVNGTPMQFVVDTGATDIVLNESAARRIGLDPDNLTYLGRASTANGTVQTAFVRLDRVTLGEVTDTNVAAVVTAGEMREPLLGMGYLQRWGKIEISGNELTLTR